VRRGSRSQLVSATASERQGSGAAFMRSLPWRGGSAPRPRAPSVRRNAGHERRRPWDRSRGSQNGRGIRALGPPPQLHGKAEEEVLELGLRAVVQRWARPGPSAQTWR
jgi:hypothetical protein